MFVFLEVLIQTLNFSDPWVRWVSWPKSGFLESLHLTVAVRLDFAQYVYILHFFFSMASLNGGISPLVTKIAGAWGVSVT